MNESIEEAFLEAYAEGFREGLYDSGKSVDSEALQSIIDQSYEISNAKTVAINFSNMYE